MVTIINLYMPPRTAVSRLSLASTLHSARLPQSNSRNSRRSLPQVSLLSQPPVLHRSLLQHPEPPSRTQAQLQVQCLRGSPVIMPVTNLSCSPTLQTPAERTAMRKGDAIMCHHCGNDPAYPKHRPAKCWCLRWDGAPWCSRTCCQARHTSGSASCAPWCCRPAPWGWTSVTLPQPSLGTEMRRCLTTSHQASRCSPLTLLEAHQLTCAPRSLRPTPPA